jgi:hypothetical protein
MGLRSVSAAQSHRLYCGSRPNRIHRARGRGLHLALIIGVEQAAEPGEEVDQELDGGLEDDAEGRVRLFLVGGPEAGRRESQEGETNEQDDGFLKISFPHSGLLQTRLALGK